MDRIDGFYFCTKKTCTVFDNFQIIITFKGKCIPKNNYALL